MTEDDLLRAHAIANESPDEALSICNEILNEHFDDQLAQRALFVAGYIMMQAERYGLAYNIYQRCANLRPDISDIWSNMGMCLEEHDPEKAKKMFEKAIAIDHKNDRAIANLGLMNLITGNPDRCIDLSSKALKLNPGAVAARHNMSLANLMLRNWKDGWQGYFDTLGVKHREERDYGLPRWNGEPGSVLVYGEQGVGDEIMFASCLADLAKTNEVIFDCDARLEGIFRRSFDFPVFGTRFKRQTPILDDYKPDYQCAIGQLPRFFRNSEDSFPGTPYLKPDPERCLQWRALFDSFPGKKIGIAWRGGLKNTGESNRSLSLDDLQPIFDDKNTFISLEYKPVSMQELDRYGIKSYQRATGKGLDIDELAALINELDFVVTACTTAVYVAGALGKPCIVLVPKDCGYRYHKSGESFPWYSSVHLFRQNGSWRQTVSALKNSEIFGECLESL